MRNLVVYDYFFTPTINLSFFNDLEGVTNVATNSDLPAQTLIFSLVTAPSNAAINSTSGVFTWTPTEAQGQGTNIIIVSVTDNGPPPLSATQSFIVVVC